MKIAVFGNIYKDEFSEDVYSLIIRLKELGAEIVFEKEFGLHINETMKLDLKVNELFDKVSDEKMALSFGGDGTLLRTAHAIGRREIPILGINCGHLGFLTDVQQDELEGLADVLMQGRYLTDERIVLKATTSDGEVSYALNEIALHTQDIAAIMKIRTQLNGEMVTSYLADGMLVATPTGSTAYSLSVGGPILMPGSHNLILTPIASHSLNARPLVVPDYYKIDLHAECRKGYYYMVSDGESRKIDNNVSVHIERADFGVKIVRLENHSFLKTLRKKLLWGANVIAD